MIVIIDSVRGALHHISNSLSNDFSIVYAITSLDPMVEVNTFAMRSAFKRSDRNRTAWGSKSSLRFTQHKIVSKTTCRHSPLPRGVCLAGGMIVLVTSGALIDGCLSVDISVYVPRRKERPFVPSSDFHVLLRWLICVVLKNSSYSKKNTE